MTTQTEQETRLLKWLETRALCLCEVSLEDSLALKRLEAQGLVTTRSVQGWTYYVLPGR